MSAVPHEEVTIAEAAALPRPCVPVFLNDFLPSENLPEKNTFIDYPPDPMAVPRTPTTSAPAFIQRFFNLHTPLQPGQSKMADDSDDHDANSACTSSTGCPPNSPEQEQLLPRQDKALTSIGSATHGHGNCNPCAWHWKPGGCRSGENCTHCHLCPQDARKVMKKAKIATFKAQAAAPVRVPSAHEQPAYVACYLPASLASSVSDSGDSVESMASFDKAFEHSEKDGAVTRDGPVKVSIKNTFIQVELPASSALLDSRPPTQTAPGDYFKRSFRTVETGHHSAPMPLPIQAVCPISAMREPGSFAPSNDETAVHSHIVDGIIIEDIGTQTDLHALGQCTPCAYFWYKKDGCRQGEACQFCHVCKKGEIKKRKKDRVHQLKAVGAFIPGFAKVQDQVLRHSKDFFNL